MRYLLFAFVAFACAACAHPQETVHVRSGSSTPEVSWQAGTEAGRQDLLAKTQWYSVIVWHNAEEANRAVRTAVVHTTAPRPHGCGADCSTASSGRCGGDLPPCWVMMRESGGNLDAYNPNGCSGRGCFGKWQCDPRSCDGTGTEAEQDAEARRLWAGGAGCSHWAACG